MIATSPPSGDMQILVERLRGPETAGVRHTQVDILRRIEAHVRTRAKDHMIHHVMLIQTATDQETPTVILPLVLGEGATDMHGRSYGDSQASRLADHRSYIRRLP